MAFSPLTPDRVVKMVEHWLGCPPRGYLGSNYGSDVKALLQNPMGAGLADDLVTKCKIDLPVIAGLPGGGLEVSLHDVDIDEQVVVFDVAGRQIGVSQE